MRVGDLVKLRSYCRGSDRLALVIQDTRYDTCVIAFVDEPATPVVARVKNLLAVNRASRSIIKINVKKT